MSLPAAERFFSLLALVAGAGAIAMVVMTVAGSRARLAALHEPSVWMAWAVAAMSMVGSLYFSEVQNFIPCRLCWFQRIAMYPLAIILLIGATRRDRNVRWYAVPLAVVGIVISSYHYLIEWYPQLETGSCDPTAPCSVPYFRQFGFVSLSFMAWCGFAAILALLLLVPDADHCDPADTSLPPQETSDGH